MKARSAARTVALRPDPSAIHLDQLPRDVQAQTGASDRRSVRPIDALKTLEQSIEPFGGNAEALVLHAQPISAAERWPPTIQMSPPAGEYLIAFDIRLRSTRFTCAASASAGANPGCSSTCSW